MEEMLNKLELMLIGLRQMKISVVFTWFPKMNKEDIIRALEESPKFKIDGDIITLKSETEIYEEELQKDILKDLMDEGDSELDMLSDYDDDLELVEIFSEEESDIKEVKDEKLELDKELNLDEELKEEKEEVKENTNDIWADLQELANSVADQTLKDENLEEIEGLEDIEELEDIEDTIEDVEENFIDEQGEELKDKEVQDEEVYEEIASTIKLEREDVLVENVIEKIVEKTVVVTDVTKINGADINYEDLVRIIKEYNESSMEKLLLSDTGKFDTQVKAIKTFYQNKYIVKEKEINILDSGANIYSLVHKRKGIDVGYLIICDKLNEAILEYMLDNYDDEVVYFCPIEGTSVEFEIGLNEFYLKDTGIIFDKYLEHYEIKEEQDFNIKNVEVVIGR